MNILAELDGIKTQVTLMQGQLELSKSVATMRWERITELSKELDECQRELEKYRGQVKQPDRN